eukprot:TRINITY_DN25880_c0_g1_i6.p2 TRINITY_DN25880_c0_g1~~TRINITY_DN25880_c0_g1_i6.p2  ORF type:complete len:344 (+),score=69.11 TRINITY_DN25880_c0_g1_i6:181-1212(+)
MVQLNFLGPPPPTPELPPSSGPIPRAAFPDPSAGGPRAARRLRCAGLCSAGSLPWRLPPPLPTSPSKREVHFAQVGACDGHWEESNDPIQQWYLTRGNWRGVAAEVVPHVGARLRQQLQRYGAQERIFLWTEAVLRGPRSQRQFYHLSANLTDGTHGLRFQLGSLRHRRLDAVLVTHTRERWAASAAEWARQLRRLRGQVRRIVAPASNASEMWAAWQRSPQCERSARCGALDWLAVDAEGADREVVLSFIADAGLRPAVVSFEARDAAAVLHDHDYVVAANATDGSDRAADFVALRADIWGTSGEGDADCPVLPAGRQPQQRRRTHTETRPVSRRRNLKVGR